MSAVEAEIEAGRGRELSHHQRLRTWAAVVPEGGTLVLSSDFARALVREFEDQRRMAQTLNGFDGILRGIRDEASHVTRLVSIMAGTAVGSVLALGAIAMAGFAQ